MFIEALSKLRALVVDVTTSTGWFQSSISTFIFQHLHIVVSIILPLTKLFTSTPTPCAKSHKFIPNMEIFFHLEAS